MISERLRRAVPVSLVSLRVFLLVAGMVGVQVFLLTAAFEKIFKEFNTELPGVTEWILSREFKIFFVILVAVVVLKEFFLHNEFWDSICNAASILVLLAIQVMLITGFLLPFMPMIRLTGGT